MGIIFFGVHQSPIGINEFYIKCPACEDYSWADVLIVSKYFHVYWVPVFPTEKQLNIVCKKCGLKRYNLPFDEKFVGEYSKEKKKFRHPWYTYCIVGFFGTIIFMAVFFTLYNYYFNRR